MVILFIISIVLLSKYYLVYISNDDPITWYVICLLVFGIVFGCAAIVLIIFYINNNILFDLNNYKKLKCKKKLKKDVATKDE